MPTKIEKLDSTGTVAGLVILDSDMIWIDRSDWNPIISEIEDTIQGGRTPAMEIARTDEIGRPITLEGSAGIAPQSQTTVDALYALLTAETKYKLTITTGTIAAGGAVTIEEGDITIEKYVIFRNWEKALEFTQFRPYEGIPGSNFLYYGTIRMEVCKYP